MKSSYKEELDSLQKKLSKTTSLAIEQGERLTAVRKAKRELEAELSELKSKLKASEVRKRGREGGKEGERREEGRMGGPEGRREKEGGWEGGLVSGLETSDAEKNNFILLYFFHLLRSEHKLWRRRGVNV